MYTHRINSGVTKILHLLYPSLSPKVFKTNPRNCRFTPIYLRGVSLTYFFSLLGQFFFSTLVGILRGKSRTMKSERNVVNGFLTHNVDLDLAI